MVNMDIQIIDFQKSLKTQKIEYVQRIVKSKTRESQEDDAFKEVFTC